MNKDDIIARCIGENSVTNVEIISKNPLKQGSYVCMEENNSITLGMINKVYSGNLLFDEKIQLPDDIEQVRNTIHTFNEYYRADVKILGDIDTLELSKVALKSNTPVRLAKTDELNKIFNNNDGIELGTITSNKKVKINLDPDQMISKHLAILAMTGGGKSNTTAVIIDEILKIHGCIVLFDMHSEYGNIEFKNGNVNRIKAEVNLYDLKEYEIAKLSGISSQASTQERVLYQAIKNVKNNLRMDIEKVPDEYSNVDRAGQEKIKASVVKEYKLQYLDKIKYELNNLKTENNKKENESIEATIAKINHNLIHKHKAILNEDQDEDIVKQIKPNCVNIIEFGQIDEMNAKIIIDKLLKDILLWRKNAELNNEFTDCYINYPVFCMIEEAHTLASNDDENNGPRYRIQRIAKEGRKFGVGLGLISQRPKNLDSDILSQINNWIVLKIVEPGDQRYIQECSDNISNELIEELPSLNTGEAIITGPMVKMPSICKINLFKGKKIGQNPKITNKWKNYYEKKH
ncbi:MAG: DUF87 domain-containing protein [Methanosphaera sp.]|nr:DUF87 domain-containing protein [Methanosphaera sp.]